MSFSERMSSMKDPDILSAIIKEGNKGNNHGAYGRLQKDQNIWNPESITSSDDATRPEGSRTLNKAYSDLKIAKGTAAEEAVCFSLQDKFSSIEVQKKIAIDLKEYTKSDVIATNAKENVMIGDILIKKGESMGIEVKCGEKEYLSSEVSHIDKQLTGFDIYEKNNPSSKFHKIVMVTADYYQMSDCSRKRLDKTADNHNAHIHVLPFYAHDITQTLARIQ